MTPTPLKPVNSNGLTWQHVSRNERTITHAGRHFFACRCRPGTPWEIHEHDRCINTHGSATPLRVWDNNYHISQLSDAIRCIVGELDGHHPSKSWSAHWRHVDVHRATT